MADGTFRARARGNGGPGPGGSCCKNCHVVDKFKIKDFPSITFGRVEMAPFITAGISQPQALHLPIINHCPAV